MNELINKLITTVLVEQPLALRGYAKYPLYSQSLPSRVGNLPTIQPSWMQCDGPCYGGDKYALRPNIPKTCQAFVCADRSVQHLNQVFLLQPQVPLT